MLEYIFPDTQSQIHSLILYQMMHPQRDAVSAVVVTEGVDRMSSPLGIHGLGMETDTKNTATTVA